MTTGTEFRVIAQRVVNADAWWVETVSNIHPGLSREGILAVLGVYLKHKLLKLDAVHGRYIVRDGRVFDLPVIERALVEASVALPAKLRDQVTIPGPNGSTLVVTKISRNEYSAKVSGINDHCRFGRSGEIRNDIDNFLQTGRLPRGERW